MALLILKKADFRARKIPGMKKKKKSYVAKSLKEAQHPKCVGASQESTKIHKEKLVEVKWKMDKPIIIAGEFNTLLSVIDRKIERK